MNWKSSPLSNDFKVSSSGLVIPLHFKDPKSTHGYLGKNGYHYVKDRDGRSHYVHRLVCSAFHGPPSPEKPFVNHLDGVKQNNTPGNLEWCTPRENSDHAWDHGLVDNRTPIKVWDFYEDTVHEFNSLGSCKELFGKAIPFQSTPYQRRYLMRQMDDTTPWPLLEEVRTDYLIVRIDPESDNHYLFTCPAEASRYLKVTEKTVAKALNNSTQYVNGHLVKYYNDKTPWIDGKRLIAAKNRKGISIVIYNTIDQIGIWSPSALAADGVFGLGYFRYANAIRKKKQYVGNGVLVKEFHDHTDWLPLRIIKNKQMSESTYWKFTDSTGNVKTFTSMKALARYIGIPDATLRYRLSKGETRTATGVIEKAG